MATANQIIQMAYEDIGYLAAGETLTAEDSEFALRRLNSIVDEWNTIPGFRQTVNEVVSTVTAHPVTVGPSLQVNIPRPVDILDGSFVRINGVDFTLYWIDREQYNNIVVKGVSSTIAIFAYYDKNFPTANIYLWPQLQAGAELHLQIPYAIPQFADYTTDYDVIPGYLEALALTLADRLPVGNPALKADVKRRAMLAQKAIKRTNFEATLLNDKTVTASPYALFMAGLV